MGFRSSSRAPRCSGSSARSGQIGFLTLRRYKFWSMHSTQLGKPFRRAAPPFASERSFEIARQILAKSIIEDATRGERDQRELSPIGTREIGPVESEGSTASPLPKSMMQQTTFSTPVRHACCAALFCQEQNLAAFSLSRAGVREMAAARDYQRFSARCLEAARRTDDPQHRAFLVEMAQAWRRLAEEAMSSKGAQVVCSAAEPDRGD